MEEHSNWPIWSVKFLPVIGCMHVYMLFVRTFLGVCFICSKKWLRPCWVIEGLRRSGSAMIGNGTIGSGSSVIVVVSMDGGVI